MARHLSLPGRQEIGSRRSSSTPPGDQPKREGRTHGGSLRNQLAVVLQPEPSQAPTNGIDPDFVFKIRASSRLSDADLRNKGLQPLGESAGWDYFVLPQESAATTFFEAIDAYIASDEGKTVFSKIDGLERYGATDRRGHGLEAGTELTFPILVDIHVWPASSGPEARARLAPINAVLGEQELASDTQPAFLLIRARVDEPTLEQLLNLSAVERIRTPPEPYLSPTDWIGLSLGDDLVRPEERPGVVGIIDDGVYVGHPLLSGIVDSFEVPAGRTWAPLTQHGTMVAGLAAYGGFEDALRDGEPLARPLSIIAARVVEATGKDGKATYPTDTPEHLILEQAIRELVRRGARVVNISLTDRTGYSGPHVDQRTETLDRLARELDLVLVLASGNIGQSDLPEVDDLHANHPSQLLTDQARVAEPAIAANCITVGSIARSGQGALPDGTTRPEMRAVALQDQVSPFSRSGPGFHQSGSVKPDLVHYGGNLVSEPTLSKRRLTDANPGAAVVSLAHPSPFHAGSGTSFAAPQVARIAAVVRETYPEASANLTRALVGLSSTPPIPHRTKSSAKAPESTRQLRLVGYGRPDEFRAVESVQHRVVMTFDGDLEVNTTVIHPIPVPEEFATGKSDRSISVALAYDPPTRRFRREYLASRMQLDFYRAVDLDELRQIVAKQPREADDRKSFPKGRQRVQDKLKPSSTSVKHSTLHVRRWQASAAKSLDPDDGDLYFLVVTHFAEPWAELAEQNYDHQKYAIAVELEDRGRQHINILERVRERGRAEV